MPLCRWLFGLLAIALGTGAAGAALPPLVIEADPLYAGAAAALRFRSGLPRRHLEAWLGQEEPGPPIQVVLAAEGSRAAAVPRWVAGYALPERDLVVLLPARIPAYPHESLEAVLAHEVAHVLLARAAGGQALPRWFSEGAALVASRELELSDRARILAGGWGVDPSLGGLERAFGGSPAQARAAYALSAVLVQDLSRRHGGDVVPRVARERSRTASFSAAWEAVTGMPLEGEVTAFFRRAKIWYRWVPLLSSGASLWLAITVLALAAGVRRRRRDAAIRQRWEEEERGTEAAPGGGGWIH